MAHAPAQRWLAVAAWIVIIFTAIPFVRRLREFFVSHWPAELLGFAVMGVVAAAAGAAMWVLRRRRERIPPADIAWLACIAGVLIYWTWSLMEQPEEAVHFLEYGVLGVLLYRALRPTMNNPGIFVAAALIGTIVGTIDETIQWVVPDRYWDFRDLVLNGGASVLVQLAVWRLASRPFSRMTASTVRTLSRLAAVECLLLILCFAATPQRLAGLSHSFPVFAHLANSNDVICEYGFLHRLDAKTSFRSRLSRNELSLQDARRSVTAAAELDRFKGRYRLFQQSISPSTDPFTYEARVHVFARNQSFAEARRFPKGSRKHALAMTVAAREQRILAQIFGDTVNRSIFRWNDHRITEVETAEDADAPFVSNVAGHLITGISEPMLMALMFAVLIALIATSVVLGRRVSRFRPPATPE